jgi:phage major head subunit gpT-like protein
MSIDKIKPENYQDDLTDQNWDKQIDAKASKRQVGGDHYKKLAIQPAEYCYKNNLNNLESEAISYITRNRLKNGSADIKKAIHTLELLLEYLDN